MKRILVTGAGGFIGSMVCRQLTASGHEAFGLDRSLPSGLPAEASWIRMDLADPQAQARLARLPRFDAVVHCAAAIPDSFTGPAAEQARQANACLDAQIIGFCHGRGLRLVYCSSSSVYGAIAGEVVDETHRLDADRSPYAAGKIQSEERICRDLPSFAVLRICAPYGPAQKGRTVMRIFIENAMAGAPLAYHGSGLREQDFTHVKDVASAIVQAVRHVSVNGIFNIAGGAPISMKDLAHRIARVVGKPGATVCASGCPDHQEEYRARFSIRRAGESLGWKPAIPLEQGIREWAAQLADSER